MRISSGFRAALVALTALTGVEPVVGRPGRHLRHLVLGDQGRLGHRRLGRQRHAALAAGSYPISIGGISYGLRVRRVGDALPRPRSNFSGSPTTWPASMARPAPAWRSACGAQAIVLSNEKGATLELTGRQVGLQINADLSGLAISMR